jgi:bifunctional DNA-binding transcriptional regulator/antitoxin component of YhaV-PrlF toxin-antitoxin module
MNKPNRKATTMNVFLTAESAEYTEILNVTPGGTKNIPALPQLWDCTTQDETHIFCPSNTSPSHNLMLSRFSCISWSTKWCIKSVSAYSAPSAVRSLKPTQFDGILITMTATIEIDDAGRLVLPESALRQLGLKPGSEFSAEVSKLGIRMMEAEKEDNSPELQMIENEDGIKVFANPKMLSDEDIVIAIKQSREDRDSKLAEIAGL